MAGSNGRTTRPRWAKLSADSGSTIDQPAPAATRPQRLAKNSASTTAFSGWPAAAKGPRVRVRTRWGGAGITHRWLAHSLGGRTRGPGGGWGGGREGAG